MRGRMIPVVLFFLVSVAPALAQTTAFTYQGKLTDSGNPASGNYDIQFKLFDTASVGTGTQQGATLTNASVAVTAGIFTVGLDFGAAAFNGLPRFLEIGVRQAGSPNPYTLLSPRQPVTSTPYAVRSLNASVADTLSSACVGCVTSTQVGSVAGSTVTGQVPVASVPAGSASYVQNGTAQQAASNFNISGNGTAGGTLTGTIVSATTQFNIGVNHALSLGSVAGVFAGRLAGNSNTTGSGNSFFGDSAGRFNTTTANNSFFGREAGTLNTASDNSFFGAFAGDSNTTGTRNSFFGRTAGDANQTGNDNSFYGYNAGKLNTVNFNSFFGSNAGSSTTTGGNNAFFGSNAGFSNTIGTGNNFFGNDAGHSNTNGSNNNFFGINAGYSNTSGLYNNFFGRLSGQANTTGIENSFFGEEAGSHNTTGDYNAFIGAGSGVLNTTGLNNSFIGSFTGGANIVGSNNTLVGANSDLASDGLNYATAIGAEAVASLNNSIFLGRPDGSDSVRIPGTLVVSTLGSAGSTSICLNAANRISSCSSSVRYKTSVQSFSGGLDVVRRLRPIAFNWKDGGMRDVGFAAEEVEKVEPLLVTYNKKGEIEGVKYGQLTTVLVNAVNEQQTQIEQQHKQIHRYQKQLATQQTRITEQGAQLAQQQHELDAFKQLLCRSHPKDGVCKATKRKQ